MNINDRITERRKSLGYTIEELATMVGVAKSTVSKWESGLIANMGHDKIVKLAKALNCTPAYLMGWEDEPNSKTPLTKEFVERIINEALDGRPLTQELLDMLIPVIKAVAKSYHNSQQ